MSALVSGDTMFPAVYNQVLHVTSINFRLQEINRPIESYVDGTPTLIRLALKVYTSLFNKNSK
jgi:hypothetical protein